MNGILNILKPPHMTSSDVVGKIKKIFNTKKVGHMGTLDPGAAGVLLIGIGKSTRLFSYLLNSTKIYRAIFRFSIATDTIDSYGKITHQDGIIPSYDDVLKALEGFRGQIMQRPPKYSAVNVGGRRAYDIARSGKNFELNKKQVTIKNFELKSHDNEYFEFDIECSSGTYIRSLCSDLAAKLDTYAYMSSLIRLACGNFKILDSVALDEIQNTEKFLDAHLIAPKDALCNMEDFEVDSDVFFKLRNGIRVNLKKANGDYKLFCAEKFYGIVTVENDTVFFKTFLEE